MRWLINWFKAFTDGNAMLPGIPKILAWPHSVVFVDPQQEDFKVITIEDTRELELFAAPRLEK